MKNTYYLIVNEHGDGELFFDSIDIIHNLARFACAGVYHYLGNRLEIYSISFDDEKVKDGTIHKLLARSIYCKKDDDGWVASIMGEQPEYLQLEFDPNYYKVMLIHRTITDWSR